MLLAVYMIRRSRSSTNHHGIVVPPITITEDTPLVAQAASPNPVFQTCTSNEILEMSIMSNSSSEPNTPIAFRTRSHTMQSAQSSDLAILSSSV